LTFFKTYGILVLVKIKYTGDKIVKTAKPTLKPKCPRQGEYSIFANNNNFYGPTGFRLVSYVVEITNPTEKEVGVVKSLTFSSGKTAVFSRPVKLTEVEAALNGSLFFDYPLIQEKKLSSLRGRDFEKIKPESDAFLAGDFGMQKYPELGEKLKSLKVGGVTDSEIFFAYNSLNGESSQAQVMTFTKWSQVTTALSWKLGAKGDPEGTDGWR
jgi:hypothetical protein